jgi:hypothetical protein
MVKNLRRFTNGRESIYFSAEIDLHSGDFGHIFKSRVGVGAIRPPFGELDYSYFRSIDWRMFSTLEAPYSNHNDEEEPN